MTDKLRIAVIGAGISGLSFAKHLLEHTPKGSIQLTLFEKSRGISGRCATRRLSHPSKDIKFDHGAQYFTVSTPQFKQQLQIWQENGIVQEWKGKIVAIEGGKIEEKKEGPPRYIGAEGMNSFGKDMAKGLDVRTNTRITKLERNNEKWSLLSEAGETFSPFDWIILTAPAPQTSELLQGVDFEMAKRTKDVNFKPTWAYMIAFGEGVTTGLPYDGAFINKDPTFSWIAKNSSKREGESENWVLHCNADFSREHIEATPDAMNQGIMDAFYKTTGVSRDKVPFHQLAFKWRFAQPDPLDDPFLMNKSLKIGACGDWCKGSKVEGAYMAGYNLSVAIFQQEFPKL